MARDLGVVMQRVVIAISRRCAATTIRCITSRCRGGGPFGTLIASGPHVVALMMGLDATFLSKRGDALGLGFEFRFVKAVPSDAELTLEWTVDRPSAQGVARRHVVSVEGRAVDDAGIVYVSARAAIFFANGTTHEYSAAILFRFLVAVRLSRRAEDRGARRETRPRRRLASDAARRGVQGDGHGAADARFR